MSVQPLDRSSGFSDVLTNVTMAILTVKRLAL